MTTSCFLLTCFLLVEARSRTGDPREVVERSGPQPGSQRQISAVISQIRPIVLAVSQGSSLVGHSLFQFGELSSQFPHGPILVTEWIRFSAARGRQMDKEGGVATADYEKEDGGGQATSRSRGRASVMVWAARTG
jgi:hypothetical protein